MGLEDLVVDFDIFLVALTELDLPAAKASGDNIRVIQASKLTISFFIKILQK